MGCLIAGVSWPFPRSLSGSMLGASRRSASDYVNLADPQRVARRNQLGIRPTVNVPCVHRVGAAMTEGCEVLSKLMFVSC